mmetsp:Transcript_32019/g.56215  ORF Transcript_32019/g.56215 Transcript_32019/m.56215 type:complete len:159 (-) Transcript_32019:145-621(-)
MEPELREAVARRKLERFHDVIEKKLKVSLRHILEHRDKLYAEHSDYIQLRNNIRVIQDSKQRQLKSLVNLGSEFYAQAVVPNPEYIFVDVGLTLKVQFTLEEAVAFCHKKEAHLKQKADKLTKKASELKAHIKLVYDAMAEIMRLDALEREEQMQKYR